MPRWDLMKNHNIFQKAYYLSRSRLGVIKRDIKSKNLISLNKYFKMWALGFEAEKYYLYDLKNNDYKDYLSDSKYAITRFINYPYDVMFNNKLIFEKIVSQFIRVPKSYGFVDNGTIFSLQSEIKIDTIESIINICREQGGVVIKPIFGSQGNGVVILKIKDDEIFMNGKKIDRQELKKYIANLDDYIITEYIKQGEYARDLYPDSTNTMRIIMMVDPDTNKPFIAGAVQRIGGKNSGGLDNFSQGGYSANIDLDSGDLSAAVTKVGTLEAKELTWVNIHPDTGLQIKGVRVPDWDNIKQKLLDMMEELPYIKYVGWDVAVTDNDIVIIEGNSHFQVGVIQLHKPLLKDAQVRKFYKYYGII